MDGWNTIVSFWGPAYFQGRLLLVSGSVLQNTLPKMANIFSPTKNLHCVAFELVDVSGVAIDSSRCSRTCTSDENAIRKHRPASSKWPFDRPNGGHSTHQKGHLKHQKGHEPEEPGMYHLIQARVTSHLIHWPSHGPDALGLPYHIILNPISLLFETVLQLECIYTTLYNYRAQQYETWPQKN